MSDFEDTGETGAAAPPVRIKQVGATSVACPMLTQTNYTVWSLRIKVVLRIHDVWSVIDTEEKNEKKNNLAMGLLYQAIPKFLIMQIGEVESSKELWESIKARYVGADRVKEARLQTLVTEFDRLTMIESETVDSFAGKLSGIASKSASLGEMIGEAKMVKKLLSSVPRNFIHLVASLEQILDLNTVGYEDIVGRLKAYEERVRMEDGDENRVMFTSTGGGWRSGGGTGSSGASGASGGKKTDRENDRRKGYNHGSGSGGSGSNPAHKSNQPIFNDQPNSNKKCNCDCCEKNRRNRKKDRSKIVCYRCDKPGHYASECPERHEKSQVGDFSGGEDNEEPLRVQYTIRGITRSLNGATSRSPLWSAHEEQTHRSLGNPRTTGVKPGCIASNWDRITDLPKEVKVDTQLIWNFMCMCRDPTIYRGLKDTVDGPKTRHFLLIRIRLHDTRHFIPLFPIELLDPTFFAILFHSSLGFSFNFSFVETLIPNNQKFSKALTNRIVPLSISSSMSGTPNKRAHDDSGGHPSVSRYSHPHDDSGMGMGGSNSNSKLPNPSGASEYHPCSFDMGQDARMPKVPRTERLPMAQMYRASSMNDGQSDHPEENTMKVGESKEAYQGSKSDKDVRYAGGSRGEDHKEGRYERDAYPDYRSEGKSTDKDVYNPGNSHMNWKESNRTWKYPSSDASASDGNANANANAWHVGRNNVHGQVENVSTEEKDYDDVKERDRKRKEVKHREWGGEANKDPTKEEKESVVPVKEKEKEKEDGGEQETLPKQKSRDLDKERRDGNGNGNGDTERSKDSDDGGGGGGGDLEREAFNYGVQQRKRMLRPRGSPQVGNRDPRFRSRPHDNDTTGKGEVSGHVIYRVGECMQELIKLWKEYETAATGGPTLEIRIPAEHVSATNRQVKGGQLWGTDIYTDDSDLVAVLMHTGYCRPTASPPPPAIQELRATVRVLPPQDCYVSTLRNNVRSRAWGAAIGCSFRVERCYIVKKGGGTIDVEACLTHTSTVEPTLAPVVVERTMTTRAAASNALRQQRFVREVTLQYNLCNEPWIKYSISAIADKGLKKPLFTSARLKKGQVLYLESRTRRYELCFNGEKMVKANDVETTTATDGDGSSLMDVFRWSQCKKPLPQTVMRAIGIPLPPDHLQVLEENLDWEDIQWSQTGVWISGNEYPLSRNAKCPFNSIT
ncbi:hypothetical protein LXL04_034782 [Taraxacum kok-saghyz]